MPHDPTIETVPAEALTAAVKVLEDAIAKVESSNITQRDILLEEFKDMKGQLRALEERIESGGSIPVADLTHRQRAAVQNGERERGRGFLGILQAALNGQPGDREESDPPDGGDGAGEGAGGDGSGGEG